VSEAREITAEILLMAPFILLPTSYRYQAWWPWVKNYEGEMYVGPVRTSPLYARSWIDQRLKKSMGF
jgi:peptide/nickel transport system substrate-binding protein